MNNIQMLSKEDRLAMIDALAIFGKYPRATYEKYSDERLAEEYDRIVGNT
ncbi:hypothetical protein [Rummeliibacillus sp. POC4]|nr:hypothetical protein [Rummeliibacillus sp. POC4]